MQAHFGNESLSPERRVTIQQALTLAGIEASPPILRGPLSEDIVLEAVSAPSPEHHPWRYGALWRWRVTQKRVLIPSASILSVIASVVGIWTFHPFSNGRMPAYRLMSGELNIAVAPLNEGGRITVDGTALARSIGRSLAGRARNIEPDLQIDTWTLNADRLQRPVTDAEAAVGLAHRTGADIVLYGDLEITSTATTVTPRFYLNTEKLPVAPEAAGVFAAGRPISVPYSIDINPQQRATLRQRIERRALALAWLFVAVGDYMNHRTEQATALFRHALRDGADQSEMTALTRLLLGNIASQRGALAVAVHDYRIASHAPVTAGRAMWGLAEVAYARARGRCTRREMDLRGLRSAWQRFHELTGWNGAAPTQSILRAKAQFGMGQVDLCLSSAGFANRWDRARREFQAVIDAYAGHNSSLRDDAAEARAGQGLVALRAVKPRQRSYIQALSAYDAAARATTFGRRRAFFRRMATWLSQQLADRVDARHAPFPPQGLNGNGVPAQQLVPPAGAGAG